MPRASVSRDQFEWDDDRLIHKPTGARFAWSYPNTGSNDLTINWGKAGDVLYNDDDYDRDAVYRIAGQLLVERRAKRR